jgi:hypothetical protein
VRVSLTDGDVAAVARQAVDLLDPEIDITITPQDRADPYRWGGHAWVVSVGELGEFYVEAGWTPTEALFRLLGALANDIAETSRFWGLAFPRCSPGHAHPAQLDVEGSEVVLTCPQTGETVTRLVPDVPE